MIRTERFAYFDKAGQWHDTVQTWAEIPGTGVWAVVLVQHLAVDPSAVPMRPTRPA